MAGFTDKKINEVYKDILQTDNSNSGLSTGIKQITCGDGDVTSLYLSNRNAKVRPEADQTAAFSVTDTDDNTLFVVDSTNDAVKAGVGSHTLNTQYQRFTLTFLDTHAGSLANTHYAIPIGGNAGLGGVTIANYALGTGTNPATSLTISDSAHDTLRCYWYVMDNITIDRVIWWSGADAATGDTTRVHLMSYDVDTANGSTGGDLSAGAVLADGGDITNAGYEQLYYQQLTIGTADVNAGKVILFAFRSDSVNSDFTINATVKYHLR